MSCGRPKTWAPLPKPERFQIIQPDLKEFARYKANYFRLFRPEYVQATLWRLMLVVRVAVRSNLGRFKQIKIRG